MDKVVNGFYSLCSSLQKLSIPIAVVMIAWVGIKLITDGEDGKREVKGHAKAIIIGLACVLLAPTIGKEIAAWFM